MIKKIKFPCEVDIMSYSYKKEGLEITLPFLSQIDEDFWGNLLEEKPKTELNISIREQDDYGREDILSYLVYKEKGSTTLWIILYDISNSIYQVWVCQNHQEKDLDIFTKFCNKLK